MTVLDRPSIFPSYEPDEKDKFVVKVSMTVPDRPSIFPFYETDEKGKFVVRGRRRGRRQIFRGHREQR